MGSDERSTSPTEEVLELDHPVLNSARNGRDLTYFAMATGVGEGMNDDVDGGRHGRHHKTGTDILTSQQRQGAKLCDGFTC